MRATAHIWALLLWSALAFGQGSLEIIELRHTTAERVIPALRPLLEPGGVLTGQRNQLFVRTSPRNLEQLRQALAALDRPARRLAISVRFDDARSGLRSSVEADARVSTRGSRIEIRAGESRDVAGERVDQRLQVLEGSRAVISAGTSRPLQLRDGVLVQDVASGFEVTPLLAGDWVTLAIAPQRSLPGAAPGSVQSVGSATQVRARLGEWVELAGIAQESRSAERGLASGVRGEARGTQRIWVKVDEVLP